MNFNEQIREGIKKFPNQLFGDFQRGKSACVIGTLYHRINLDVENPFSVMDRRDIFFENVMHCPQCKYQAALGGVMAHLNDDHRWTREAIAEWADPRPELHISMPTLEAISEAIKESVTC